MHAAVTFVFKPQPAGGAVIAVQHTRTPPDRVLGDVISTTRQSAAGSAVARSDAARPDAPVEASGARIVRVGQGVAPPRKIFDVKPIYPADAQAARVEGVVIAEIRIGTDGSVVDAVIKRSIQMLDDAALDAIRQWRFVPTVVDGQPVEVVMIVTVNFSLE
jgi:protein TonB